MKNMPVSPDQGQETQIGLAVTLLFLLLALSKGGAGWLRLGVLALILVMVSPALWKPLLPFWLGLLKLLEQTLSKAVFALVFVVIIMPIGMLRRLLNVDPLRLKAWKNGTESVFTVRDHAFSAQDITQPY